MDEIRVNTDELRNGSQSLTNSHAELASVQVQINTTVSGIWNAYDGQLRQSLNRIVGGSVQIGSHLESRASELKAELLSRAIGFEAANEAGKGAVLGASTSFTQFIDTTPTLGFWSTFNRWREKAFTICSTAGLAIERFLPLIFVAVKPSILSPIPEVVKSSNSLSEKTGFGVLMERYKQENTDPNVEKKGFGYLSEKYKYFAYYNIQPKAQGILYGSAACLPTCISMVLDFYHSGDPTLNTATPEELIKMLNPNDGNPTGQHPGIGFDKFHNKLDKKGYDVETFQLGDVNDLTSKLKEGPIIVNVKVKLTSKPARDIAPGGDMDHSLLVKAIDKDSVVVNDPWSGSEKVFSRETFKTMWTKGGNWVATVRPLH